MNSENSEIEISDSLSYSYTTSNGKMEVQPLKLVPSPDTFQRKTDQMMNSFSERVEKMHIKPVFGSWFGKRLGLAPSASITARRPRGFRSHQRQPTLEMIRKVTLGADESVASAQKDVPGIQVSNKGLYEDLDFPANESSLFFNTALTKKFEWKRPHELVDNPHFIAEGASRFDVVQGELGDCWLLAAMANITLYPEVFKKVVNPKQSFDTGQYTGAFMFNIWQYGQWIEVVIDDRLPTYNGKLVYLHSADKKEFWSALLEKAYAKLHGSYQALKGGSCSEAMEDFTAGLAEVFLLKQNEPKNLFDIMRKSLEMSSMMSCSIESDKDDYQTKLSNGLVTGHAYSITATREVQTTLPNGKQGYSQLIRVRNPWGNEAEWNGPWSDSSPEWTCISQADRDKMGLIFDADGEFWMSFKDFVKCWDKLEICHLDPHTAHTVVGTPLDSSGVVPAKHWNAQSFDGIWVPGATAGGCRNFIKTFAYNPQYKITLGTENSESEGNKFTCIAALMQKNRRKQKGSSDGELLTIGFSIYKIEENEINGERLSTNYFKTHRSIARTAAFVNLREVTARFKLPAGQYCIIPSTFDPGDSGEFLLRVFSEVYCDMDECDEYTHFEEPSTPDIQPSPRERTGEPSASDKLAYFFEKLSGKDFQMDAWELQKVLTFALKTEFPFEKFSLDACHSMIACVDMSRTGKLDVEEFRMLWKMIRRAKTLFKQLDSENTGYIDSYKLRDALQAVESLEMPAHFQWVELTMYA